MVTCVCRITPCCGGLIEERRILNQCTSFGMDALIMHVVSSREIAFREEGHARLNKGAT